MPKTINPLQKRKSSSSPFSAARRTKSGSRENSAAEKQAQRLDDQGIVRRVPLAEVPEDLCDLIRYIQDHAFEEIPERSAGMNSRQIAECLQFRKRLPPVVSLAHLHALSSSSTETDRELARLAAQGKVRRISIPGRGKGGSSVGEAVALVADWKDRLWQDESIEEETKQKYMALLDDNPTERSAPVASLSQAEKRSLVGAGFLANPGALTTSHTSSFARPTGAAEGAIARAGSSAATGSLAAVGGYAAIQDSGGGGSMLATKESRLSAAALRTEVMMFSLPSMGAYLKLMTEGRARLLFLLKQLSPRYKEAAWDMLIEKWNGNVPNDPASKAKLLRGDWTGVLPGQTRKFQQFHGLDGEWLLAECVGTGDLQLFETGSVGVAVRGL
ncbi:uncharacterized protein MYCFIDRAFT_212064 [Pseudocercospora fijiensis CIRAD86]|uniref:Uncharacterized protein n=1 Tax=Pseudocercospora fijiensis (strain CIRAD86) TaxID=383855 RepID=M3A771_PSEFD|nr:uncharacterized protein MYCFIDRAFT_212064 [Pseudocercospora fijiensis CIRAD86]EME80471.1 hypothetical protein MYCFIDRAFT_212064 [Pseudocercospora fijiensis CIRAD86]